MPEWLPEEVIEACPFMESPADLAAADAAGGPRPFRLPAHLAYLNDRLVEVMWGGLRRLICNMPFGHGKTTLCSEYNAAWRLLWRPEDRLMLASFSDDFSAKRGAKVKDIFERWGPALAARLGPGHQRKLREDTHAKNEWVVEGHEGGMVCKGRRAGLVGRPADYLLLDDLIRNHVEALSEKVAEEVRDFHESVIEGRLMADAPVVSVGTRWSRRDWFGYVLAQDREGVGDEWEVVRFPAIATENDVLGRSPGAALWEWRRPLKQLERIRERKGRWWHPCWQQDPQAEEGKWFHPSQWPTWADIGGAIAVTAKGRARRIYPREDIMTLVAADWAFGEKSTSDCTAIGAFGLTPGRDLLVLEVINRRLGPSEFAPELANVCRRWRPLVVGVEEGHPTFKHDCRQHVDIPDVRWLRPGGREKLHRALPAINKGLAGHEPDLAGNHGTGIVLPAAPQPWQQEFITQLSDFTGVDDEHDDMVDMLAWAAALAQEYSPGAARAPEYGEPILLSPPMEPRY